MANETTQKLDQFARERTLGDAGQRLDRAQEDVHLAARVMRGTGAAPDTIERLEQAAGFTQEAREIVNEVLRREIRNGLERIADRVGSAT